MAVAAGALERVLSEGMEAVRKKIRAALSSDVSLLGKTNADLLSRPGKLMRPRLVLLAACALGEVEEDTVRFAAAMELLHNATLLHDDVVDHSALRRGAPTVSSLLGGTAAVLLGDFWLVRCLGCILEADRYSEQVVRRVSQTLSDLAEGEMLQLQLAASGALARPDYDRLVYGKTASLFEACAEVGCISVSAGEAQREVLAAYGRHLGMAFQMRDDIVDYWDEAPTSWGKPVGADLAEGKITLPMLCALETVGEGEEKRLREAIAQLPGHASPDRIAPLLAFVREREGVPRAWGVLELEAQKAREALSPLPSGEAKTFLEQMAWDLARRTP